MTYEELMDLARRYEGKELETVTGRKFTVGVSSAEYCPYFTPASFLIPSISSYFFSAPGSALNTATQSVA